MQEHTTLLNEKYKQLSVEYEELRQMVIDIKSQMGGTCASHFRPYSSGNDYPPPPPPPAPPLF